MKNFQINKIHLVEVSTGLEHLYGHLLDVVFWDGDPELLADDQQFIQIAICTK